MISIINCKPHLALIFLGPTKCFVLENDPKLGEKIVQLEIKFFGVEKNN